MCHLTPWTRCAVPKAFSRFGADWFGKKYQPNWYLPVILGGFGMDPALAPAGWRITKGQRVMAANFVANPKLALYRMSGNSLPVAKVGAAISSSRVIIGDYVLGENETEEGSEWLARLAMMYRASCAGNEQKVTDAVAMRQLGVDYRLKPMSVERMGDYQTARVVSVKTSNPLPLQPMLMGGGSYFPVKLADAYDPAGWKRSMRERKEKEKKRGGEAWLGDDGFLLPRPWEDELMIPQACIVCESQVGCEGHCSSRWLEAVLAPYEAEREEEHRTWTRQLSDRVQDPYF
jgi:hypothetical protein